MVLEPCWKVMNQGWLLGGAGNKHFPRGGQGWKISASIKANVKHGVGVGPFLPSSIPLISYFQTFFTIQRRVYNFAGPPPPPPPTPSQPWPYGASAYRVLPYKPLAQPGPMGLQPREPWPMGPQPLEREGSSDNNDCSWSMDW